MNNLRRNTRLIYYANYIGESPIIDEDGNETGETEAKYTEPTAIKVNISAAAGINDNMPFGSFTDYTRVISTSDINCPIDEKTVIWFEDEPSARHNYIVTKKADSINSILYALQKVDVN